MLAALLPDRAIIRASGADARRFLHGLVTADIEHMIAATPRYAALLTPQGKIIADFLVLQADDAAGENFLIDCPRALAGTLAARLGFYKLRAKVAIEDLGEAAGALALWNGAPAPSSLPSPDFGPCIADPRLPALGWRAIGPPARAAEAADALGAQIVEAAAYDSHRIALGIPSGGRDFAFGDAFPHEANMDQLHGVDFSKGCYVGQEVVSRMQHRGAARSRVVPVALLDGVAPDAGSPVTAGEKAVGAMGSAADGRGLAMLRLDRVADALAAGLPLVAGGLRIAPLKPDWATFPWPLAAQTAERTPPR